MKIPKLIKIIYIFFSIFAFLAVSVTNTNLYGIVPALVLMWITFLFFDIGFSRKNHNIDKFKVEKKSSLTSIIEKICKKRLLIVIISITFTISISYFYTGNTPTSVINTALSGDSIYMKYQKYFNENDISTFSLSKIPFIIMNVGLNLLFLISVINTISSTEKIKFKDILFLLLMTISFWYFGIARGTNFEMFEIGCIYLYSIMIRNTNQKNKRKINKPI